METVNDKLKRNIQMVTQVFDEKCKQCPKFELCKHIREVALQKGIIKEKENDNN